MTSWNAKTPHSAWAMTLRRLLLAFGFVLMNQRSQWEEAHDAIAGSASTLKLEQVAHLYSLYRSAGDDQGSGGHEVQPGATLGLLRMSFVAHADGHLCVVEKKLRPKA